MTIYYEAGLPAVLVPVRFLGWSKTPMHDVTGGYNAVIQLKKGAGTYQKGEVLHVPSWGVVEKSHKRGYHQYVKPASLPARTDANMIPARW